MSLIYLASPYTHDDPVVVHDRFVMACKKAAKLFAAGEYVFCPIAHAHPIKMVGELDGQWSFWQPYDEYMLSLCDDLYVLMLDGWKESRGVQAEIKYAERFGIPISYVTP